MSPHYCIIHTPTGQFYCQTNSGACQWRGNLLDARTFSTYRNARYTKNRLGTKWEIISTNNS